MLSTTKPQSEETAGAFVTPEKGDAPTGKSRGTAMAQVVEQLAHLRQHYLAELQAARDKVKKNFLS